MYFRTNMQLATHRSGHVRSTLPPMAVTGSGALQFSGLAVSSTGEA